MNVKERLRKYYTLGEPKETQYLNAVWDPRLDYWTEEIILGREVITFE